MAQKKRASKKVSKKEDNYKKLTIAVTIALVLGASSFAMVMLNSYTGHGIFDRIFTRSNLREATTTTLDTSEPIIGTVDSITRDFLIIPEKICEPGPFVHECNDGIDNDGDGLIDWKTVETILPDGTKIIISVADPACEGYDPTKSIIQKYSELSTIIPECWDGIDNDRDGLIDSADPECANFCRSDSYGQQYNFREDGTTYIPPEIIQPQCSDGVDNDGDGKIDYNKGTLNNPSSYDPGCIDRYDDNEYDSVSNCVYLNSQTVLKRLWKSDPLSAQTVGAGIINLLGNTPINSCKSFSDTYPERYNKPLKPVYLDYSTKFTYFNTNINTLGCNSDPENIAYISAKEYSVPISILGAVSGPIIPTTVFDDERIIPYDEASCSGLNSGSVGSVYKELGVKGILCCEQN